MPLSLGSISPALSPHPPANATAQQMLSKLLGVLLSLRVNDTAQIPPGGESPFPIGLWDSSPEHQLHWFSNADILGPHLSGADSGARVPDVGHRPLGFPVW